MELSTFIIILFLLLILSFYLIKEFQSNNNKLVTLSLLLFFIPMLLITKTILIKTSIHYIYFKGLGLQFKFSLDIPALIFLWLNYLLFLFLYTFLPLKQQNNLQNGLLLFLFVINNFFFLAGDLITFIIFWEAMLIPSTLLIYYFSGEKSRSNALEYLIYNFGFSIFLIFGIILLYVNSQTIELNALKYVPHYLIALLLYIGIMVKTPVVPLHGWLLNTYYHLPSPITAIFSGILSKYALYAFYRFFENVSLSLNFLLLITIASAIISALLALSHKDLKKIFTYMSMSHLNIMLAGSIAMLPYFSISLIIPFSLFHGLLSFILFIYIYYLESITGELNIDNYGNLTVLTPKFTFFFVTYLLVLAGFPIFAYFFIEFILLSTLFKVSILLGFLLSLAIGINLTYKAIVFYKLIFLKNTGSASLKMKDLPKSLLSLSLITFILILYLTFIFYPLLNLLSQGGI